MFRNKNRTVSGAELPDYLRRLILFDRLLTGMLAAIAVMTAAGLLALAAGHTFSYWLVAGMAFLAVLLVFCM